jgi:hypothetical protein
MRIRRLLTTSAVTVSTVLAAATMAAAAPHQPDPRPPRAALELTITVGSDIDGTTLVCGPDGGTHRHAGRACAMLRWARGDLNRLPSRPRVCTLEYLPVRATAHGHWRGRVVSWTRVYGNRCELDAATTWVFRF